jgi:O-antigen/teichoic acid export membrane protein
MPNNSNNKTIAKNTMFLYFRMMVTIVISLYTSRVVLKVLGVDDFGLYQSVGGVVGLLSFLNAALATGSSRFLTFELGRGDFNKLKRTFSTIVTAHLILAAGLVVLLESIGLWFVYNILVIPAERFDAAVIAYHLSILTAVFHLVQVPYTATIISHEKMGIYAYVGIIDVVLKLAIVFMLNIGGIDKLVLYAILMGLISLIMAMFYCVYSMRKFNETRTGLIIDRAILKEVLGYSAWNLFANSALVLKNQGSIILLNMFFSPAVVTARAVANQVNMAAFHFISNFRTAATPQIVKRYAIEDYDGSKSLLLSSTKYSYYMMLLLALPIFLVAPQLLELWLGQVPPFSIIFLRLTIVASLFQVFDSCFYTALYAKGQIKENAMLSPTVLFISFPVVYILFRMGYSPETYAWMSLVSYAVLALIVKPILIIKIVNYTWKDIISVFIPCAKVTVLACAISLLLYLKEDLFTDNIYLRFIFFVLLSVTCVLVAVWIAGINTGERRKIIAFVKHKIVN